MKRKLLVVDPDAAVQSRFARIFRAQTPGGPEAGKPGPEYDLDAVGDLAEAETRIKRAEKNDRSYRLVFLAVDSVEDLAALDIIWGCAPRMPVVLLCTPDEESNISQTVFELDNADLVLMAQKPVDAPLIRRMVDALLDQLALNWAAQIGSPETEARVWEETQRSEAAEEPEPEAPVEEAVAMNTDFMLNLSHEIRTTLSSVLGVVDLIKETRLDSNQRDLMGILQESGEMLMNLVNNMLDLAKLEHGNMVIAREPFDVHQSVNAVGDLMETRALQKGNAVTVRVDPKIPHRLIGDGNRLRQILVNLVGNAVKFTEKGVISIEVDVDGDTEKEVALNFAVRDTGIGIDEEGQRKLFQEFGQVSQDGQPTTGTGLGLALCRGLVEMMGGQIWLTSTPGEGSAFFFSINLGKPTEDQFFDDEESFPIGPRTGKVSEYGGRVLVVDDNPTNRKVALSFLKIGGYRGEYAGSGKEALDWLEGHTCDLVLMDIQMPVMDGFEATRKIRETNEDIPVIAMTANVFRRHRERCQAVGMDDFLAKPIRRRRFLEMVAKWIGPPDAEKLSKLPKLKEPEVQTEHKVFQVGATPIDVQRAIEEFEDDRELVRRVLAEFCDGLNERLNIIEHALVDCDYETLSAEAHSLKGGCANICAEPMAQIAAELEDCAKESKTDALPALVSGLSRESGRLVEYLRFYWNQG
ncbi:MAG: ATP-binding protein [Acidobacteriota bacterium]|nr:ATP-binding protein [Acidobacteriota bacterium]